MKVVNILTLKTKKKKENIVPLEIWTSLYCFHKNMKEKNYNITKQEVANTQIIA